MKTLKSKITKQNRRRMRRRIVSILTAVVVFLTTYALVIPAITMDTETAAQEPGIEIAQPAPESVVSEPAPVQAEPIAAEPVAAEPVAAEAVAQPAADPAAAGADNAAVAAVDASAGVSDATGDSAVVEIADGTTPLAAPEATASSGLEGENATSEEENQDKNTETETDEKDKENEENEEEKKLAVSPLVYDNAEYTVKVSFGESAQIPDGTTLSWREFATGTTEYGASRMILNNKMKENGIAEEDLEEAISSNRFFEVLFIDKNGAQFLPMDTVDVLVEYKDAANANVNNQVPAEGGSLYAVTFRTDDGQPTKANLITTNAKDGSAGLEAAGGFIRCLRVQDFPANDYHTNAVIGQVVVKDTNAEEPEIVTTLDDEKEEEILTTQYLTADGEAYNITLSYGPEAGIPDGAKLAVSEIVQASDTYEEYVSKTENALDPAEKVVFARFFDIKIMKDGVEIQPNGAVNVKIELADTLTEEVKVVHFEHNDAQAVAEAIVTPVVLDSARVEAEALENAVGFETESFSVFGIVGTETISTQVITAEGETYTIEVTYGPEAEIPEDSNLKVKEIIEGEEYKKYLSKAENALSDEENQADISFARFFDIEIWNNDEKIEPKAAVEVKIINETALSIAKDESLSIVHFADSGTEIIDDVSLSKDGTTTVHEQSSFSVTGEIVGSFSGNNWPSVDAGNYVLVVNTGTGGPYYAVNSDGSLTEVEYDTETGNVTFLDAASTDDLNSYLWTHFVSGTNHRLTSVTNPDNKIYPVQTQDGSAISNSAATPGVNQGYIYRGRTNNRYCVAINDAGTSLISSKVTYNAYNGGYTYPSNAAHFQFATNFEVDVDGAYGTANSIILTGNSKTLRMAEVTTDDEELIDFEGFTWRSSNTNIVTVSTDPDTDAPIATGVAVGTARIVGTRVNEHGETDEVIWTVTVKDKTSNSIVFLHQPQDNTNFANQDNIRPHDGYGNTEPTNYVKFVVALADEDGNIILYDGKPNVELPEGAIVPDRYEFELDSSGVFAIEEDTLSGISVPGYSYAGTYAYFGWYNNTDLDNMAVVSEFKNLGSVSSRYPQYYSVLGFKTSRGNPQYQDYSQTAFGESGYGYYAYNPTGVLMIVLQPVSENIAYRTSYHNDYVPGGTARTNIVDTTRAKMTKGEWIADQYRWDWYGETIMTTKTAEDLLSPADGYEFVGWYDSVDSEGNGTGNQIVGQTEDGYYYALKDEEKIIIRQNNDIYAKWQLVRGTLRIEKEISGNLSDAEMESLKSALTFTVTDDNTQETVVKTGADMTWNGNKGSVDITGLSAATTYTVTEANADVTNYDVTTEIVGGTNVKVSKTGAKTVSVTNTYVKKVATIKVIKMESGTSTKLPNAEFNLYRPATELDTNPETIKINGTDTFVIKVQSISVGDSGEVEVPDLPVGSYYLIETVPPVGHNILKTVISFELNSESINLRSQDHVSANELELTVYNDSGVTLPNTGGSGTLPYTLGGIALIAFAVSMYGFRMRRRERRAN